MKEYVKVEHGVLVMKEGKAWGITYADGRETCYGWLDPSKAELSDPRFVKKPTDLTYKGSRHVKELSTARVSKVTRTVIVQVSQEKAMGYVLAGFVGGCMGFLLFMISKKEIIEEIYDSGYNEGWEHAMTLLEERAGGE